MILVLLVIKKNFTSKRGKNKSDYMENQTRPIQNINLSCEIASFHFKSKKNIDLENLLDS